MAFKRKERKVVNLEFEYGEGEVLKFEIKFNTALSKKLIDMGEKAENIDDENSEEIEKMLITAYDEILGKGAMKKIKEKVFDGDELLLADLIDIGYYIIEEVNKVSADINASYGNASTNADISKNIVLPENKKVYSIEEVQAILNAENNSLLNGKN